MKENIEITGFFVFFWFGFVSQLRSFNFAFEFRCLVDPIAAAAPEGVSSASQPLLEIVLLLPDKNGAHLTSITQMLGKKILDTYNSHLTQVMG